LEIIAGLTNPDTGRILLDGNDITKEKIQKRNLTMVFQSSTLFPHMSVYDNIAYPLKCKKLKPNQIHKRVAELAEDFNFSALLKRSPQTLSGGETQRVSLAQAVASEPGCLLLDEPISSLDAESRPQIRALLRKINALGQTIIHVTHDYTEAASLGTHIGVIEAGTIAQIGTVEEVFHRPESEFIARFVGIRNFFRGHLALAQSDQTNTREFKINGLVFSVLTDSAPGPGYIMIRSEDITISDSPVRSSARNSFEGTIVDIAPAGVGIEVIVDIVGVEIAALITAESVKMLGLDCGKKVWVSFKASAAKFIEG
jgi:molybdopterin-binding protein